MKEAGGENSIIFMEAETEHSHIICVNGNLFRKTQFKFFGFEFVNC